MRIFIMCLTLTSGLAHAGGLSSTDICAVRPDLCDNDESSVAVLARQARRQPSRAPAAAAAAKASLQRAVRALAPASVRTRLGGNVSTCRPSTVDLTSSNQALPVCGSALSASRAPAAVEATPAIPAVSFASYMKANAANPALSRKVTDYQNAFKDTSKAAVFVAPDVEGNGTREGAAPTVTPGQQARNNQ
jgi:hypothetical protein